MVDSDANSRTATPSSSTIANIFGQNLLSLETMRGRLPVRVYDSFFRTIEEGAGLSPAVADVVATMMKDWAVERGATH